MRLIDAEKLRAEYLGMPNCYNGFSDSYDKAMIVDMVDEQPTIDAVPVVRCKYCVHANTTEEGYIYGTCNHRRKGGIGHLITPQFFCAYGERKDDATND